MHYRGHERVLSLLLVALLSYSASAQDQSVQYAIRRLSLGNDGHGGHGLDVNEVGEVVGSSMPRSSSHPFVWSGGLMLDMNDVLPGAGPALGMNDRGDVVGQSPGWWWDGANMTVLPDLGDTTLAMAINSDQVIAGWSDDTEDIRRAVLWVNSELELLPLWPSGSEALAEDINDLGMVVGSATTDSEGPEVATLWWNGEMTNLGALPSTWRTSTARGVSENGMIVGDSNDDATGRDRAVLWEQDETSGMWTIRNLGSVTPDTYSKAYDVNNLGQVVGQSGCSGSCGVAFIWQDGVMRDLNDLVPASAPWTMYVARAISDSGYIVGRGRGADASYPFRLEPILLAADLNEDGAIGSLDLAELIADWGPCPDCSNCDADFDGDCDVDAADLAVLLGVWAP